MSWGERQATRRALLKEREARAEIEQLEAHMRAGEASRKVPGEGVRTQPRAKTKDEVWAEPIVACALRILMTTVRQSIRDEYEGKVNVDPDCITIHLTHLKDPDKSVYVRQVIMESDKRAGHRAELIGKNIASQLARELLAKSKYEGEEAPPKMQRKPDYSAMYQESKRKPNNKARVAEVLRKRAMKCVPCGETDDLFPEWDQVCNHTEKERKG